MNAVLPESAAVSETALKIEGATVMTGSPMRLGADLAFAFEVFGNGASRVYPSPVVAGSYLSIAVVSSGVSAGKLEALKTKLEATKGVLEGQDQALIAGLTRDDILGDMFYAGTLGYFAEYQVLAHLSALSQGNHVTVANSAGTYGYVPNVSYLLGFPRSISPGGAEMDLDRVAFASSVDGKGKATVANFTFQLCALSSALEHAIPEQMFVTPENSGEAVSAVKALQRAAQQGQRIYHITAANQGSTLPNIRQNSVAMAEIRQALAVGREVIAHAEPTSVPGWSGAGYVIFDPDSGGGAWKITGGTNGGWCGMGVGMTLGIAVGSLIVGKPAVATSIGRLVLNPYIAVILLTVVTMLSMFSIMDSIQGKGNTFGCFLKGLILGFELGLIVGLGLGTGARVNEGRVLLTELLAWSGYLVEDEYGSLPSLRECGLLP